MEGTLDGDFGGSFPFEARFVEAAGHRLHYVDEGPPGATPVLMLHGNPTWSYMYRRPIAELSRRGHRCVAFDHLGFGRSEKPPSFSDYALEPHVDRAIAVIDQLDLREVTLVMHDWGGPIGIAAAIARRERVRGLVIMNTWAWELPTFLPPFLREFRTDGLGEILALGGNMLVEAIPGGMARREADQQMLEAYRAPFPDYWSRLAALAFVRDIPLTERDRSAPAMARIHERVPDLAEIPALIVWGMRDRVFRPVFLDQWRELFRDAQVVELEDASHYLVEDRPDAVTGAVHEFLTAR
jgi:pimeloyl-ACP methyl ester carboxylesterase